MAGARRTARAGATEPGALARIPEDLPILLIAGGGDPAPNRAAAVRELTGQIQQVPSSVSAIKVKGERSYHRVRAGEDVDLPPRPVTVSRFEVLATRTGDVGGIPVLDEYVEVAGRPSCLVFLTKDADGQPSQDYRTLFLQELLRRGVLGQSFVISAAHTDADLACTAEATRRQLPVYARAIEAGTVDGLLHGRPVAPALREFAAPRNIVHR